MINRSVYLAGPIAGTSYEQCTDWRKYVCEKLQGSIIAFSPMRRKEFTQSNWGNFNRESHALTSTRGIITRDRFDVLNADAILVNLLGAERVSIGTIVELGWADAARKPIVVVIEPHGNPHDHSFVHGLAGFVVSTLDEGISVVCAILLP